MLRSLKWKFILYAAIALFAILLLLPTLTSRVTTWFTKIIPIGKDSSRSRFTGRDASHPRGGGREGCRELCRTDQEQFER